MAKTKRSTVDVVEGDITTISVDAMVNAANEALLPGGGVCGAIHEAAGPSLAAECRNLGGCRTGAAKATAGYGLPATHVIHAVGPVWQGGFSGEDDLLASSYRSALALADELGANSVSLPAISTGIFGYPPERAAAVAVSAVEAAVAAGEAPKQVLLCCFTPESAELHRRALAGRNGQ